MGTVGQPVSQLGKTVWGNRARMHTGEKRWKVENQERNLKIGEEDIEGGIESLNQERHLKKIGHATKTDTEFKMMTLMMVMATMMTMMMVMARDAEMCLEGAFSWQAASSNTELKGTSC